MTEMNNATMTIMSSVVEVKFICSCNLFSLYVHCKTRAAWSNRRHNLLFNCQIPHLPYVTLILYLCNRKNLMPGSLDFYHYTENIVEPNIFKVRILLHTIYCKLCLDTEYWLLNQEYHWIDDRKVDLFSLCVLFSK